MPTPLEMMSYVFFCGGCICGPFFEYSDYINFIENKEHYTKIPSSIGASLVRLVHGLSNIQVMFINLHSVFDFQSCCRTIFLGLILWHRRIYYL